MNIAIAAWQKINGLVVHVEPGQVSRYRKSTLGEEYKVPCALMPATVDQLSACLQIANQQRIKVFPISCGQNHGYHSAAPMTDDTVVIDLKRLDQILEFNREFGYVIIQPGVTFGSLYHFLAMQGADYMMSGFGGSSRASIIGNALDRGVGKGVYGNREKSSEIREIVLANGTIVNTRDQLTCRDITADFQHSIVGIDLGSLFYQSSLAIVTKMILHLQPIPEVLQVLAFSVNDDAKLPVLIDRLKNLNRLGVIEPVYSIYNDIRLLVGSGLYQHKDINLDNQLAEGLEKLSGNYGRKLGKWNSSFSMSCFCVEDAELRKKLVENALQGAVSGLWFYQISRRQAKNLIAKSAQDEFRVTESDFKFLFNLGYTNDYDQQTLYWNADVPYALRSQPIQDGCGLIFFAPKIPFDSGHILNSLKLCREITTKHKVKPPITFQFKTHELAYLVLPVLFNLHDGSKIAAHRLYLDLMSAFISEGYAPYRVNSISMESLFASRSSLTTLIHKIKGVFDENNILSPNKYISRVGGDT